MEGLSARFTLHNEQLHIRKIEAEGGKWKGGARGGVTMPLQTPFLSAQIPLRSWNFQVIP